MDRARLAIAILRVDAAANAIAAVACLGLASAIAGVLGIGATWPVVVLAVVLAANGVACWRAAGDGAPHPTALRRLAVVDVIFAAAVGGLALADPTGMAGATRWALAGIADLALLVAAAKVLTSRRPQEAPARAA